MESEEQHLDSKNLKTPRGPGDGDSHDKGVDVSQLLSLYGEAMVRVGQLEERLKDLEMAAQARSARQEELTRAQQQIEQLEPRIKELEAEEIEHRATEEELVNSQQAVQRLENRVSSLLSEQEILNQRLASQGTVGRRRRSEPRGWRRLLRALQKRRSG